MKIFIETTLVALGLFAAFSGGYLIGELNGFTDGRWDGQNTTVAYCGISPDYCKLRLERMAELPADEQPAIYKQLYK